MIARLVAAILSTTNLVFPTPTGSSADLQVDPTTSSCSVTFTKDGTILGNGNAFDNLPTNWVVVAATDIGASYEIEFHLNSGSVTSGTLDTWLDLTTNQSVTVGQSGVGETSAEVRVKIRRKSDNVVVSEGAVTLSSTVIV